MMVLEHVSLEREIRQHKNWLKRVWEDNFPTIFKQQSQENIKLDNFSQRTLRRFFRKPLIRGKHWPGQCFP